MGTDFLDLTEDTQKKLAEYREQKAKVEAKRIVKFFKLFPGKELTQDEEKVVLEKIKNGFASDKIRDFNYCVLQLENKVYHPKVVEMTDLCIANFKQVLKEDEWEREKYTKYLDSNGDVKHKHRLWLLERMEAYLSGDPHRRPLHAGLDITDVIFFTGTNNKIAPRQLAEDERPRMQARF